MTSRSIARGLLSLTITLGVAAGAAAQTSTGGLRGFVKDHTGGALVGVTVEASSPARIGPPAAEITDAQGLFNLSNLPVGDYTLVFTLQGFRTVRRESVRVEVGRTIQVNVNLELGAVEQAIVVTGEAPVVDATNAGFSTNFNRQLLDNIPTACQSYFDVVTFAPAVRINQVPNRALPVHRALQPAGHARTWRPDSARSAPVLRHPARPPSTSATTSRRTRMTSRRPAAPIKARGSAA